MVTLACRVFRRNGTTFPGWFTSKIFKHSLDNIKYPKYVVAVTGSSGKGSTVALTAHILEASGKKVVWNKSGSNVRSAITTLILNNTKVFSHKMEADVLLLEMDERYIKGTLPKGVITHMAITNITRDQPARNIHPNIIFEKIIESIDDEATLIINVDDPLLNRIKYAYSSNIVTYGIATTKYDTNSTPGYAVDFAYCPSCHTKLKYDSYHYGHLGVYDCPRCSFSRGVPDYEATKVDLSNHTFNIGEYKLFLNKDVFFAVYYTLLAYTICHEIGIDEESILREINDDKIESKRMKAYVLDGRNIEMLESKNENALSYLQSLNYIKNQKGKKTVIMGFENVSRRYKYNDLSWLWDVNFELLNDKSIDKIFLIGRFKYDIAVRLEYAGIDMDRLVYIDDMKELLENVEKNSKGDIYTMVCFDMTEIITNMLKEKIHDEKNH